MDDISVDRLSQLQWQSDGNSDVVDVGHGIRRSRAGTRGPRHIDPPLLTGGSGQWESEFSERKVLVDWLTVTVGSSLAGGLLRESSLEREGHATQGFRRSEERKLVGGHAWRKWDPHQESKRFGRLYESWETYGESASWLIERLRGESAAKPTRVDLAWDFYCPEWYRPEDLREELRALGVVGAGQWGINGQGGVSTVYVNGPTSPRRLRIYRKDLSPNEDLLPGEGPVLRVEYVAKEGRAEQLWRAYGAGGITEAVAVAAGHVEAMTGWRPPTAYVRGPEPLPVEVRAEGQKLRAFLDQYGSLLAMYDRVYVPVIELAKEVAASRSRYAACRERKRVERIEEQGVDEVIRAAGFCEEVNRETGDVRWRDDQAGPA